MKGRGADSGLRLGPKVVALESGKRRQQVLFQRWLRLKG